MEIKKILLARPRQPLPTLFTEVPKIKNAESPVSEKTSSRILGE